MLPHFIEGGAQGVVNYIWIIRATIYKKKKKRA